MPAVARLEDDLRDLFAHYSAHRTDRAHDEALDGEGGLRPHWRGLMDWARRAGPDGYEAVVGETRRLRLESGVAFDPTGGADVANRTCTTGAARSAPPTPCPSYCCEPFCSASGMPQMPHFRQRPHPQPRPRPAQQCPL